MTAHHEVEDQRAHLHADLGLRFEAGEARPALLLDVDQMAQDVHTVLLTSDLVGHELHLHDTRMRSACVPGTPPRGGQVRVHAGGVVYWARRKRRQQRRL